MFFQGHIFLYYSVYNFPYRNFNNQIKKNKNKKFSSTLIYHQLLDKMPKGIQGMINLNSNMIAPWVNGDNNADASNWKILKSKRQLREERKSNYNLNFPPLQSASSLGSKTYKDKIPSVKTTKSTNSSQTSSKKTSSKIRKVTPKDDEVKIIKITKVN